MAGGLQTSRGGQGPGGITNLTATIPSVATLVSLSQPSTIVTIVNYSTVIILSVDFNGGTPVVGVGNGINIAPSANFTWDGTALTRFSIIGSGVTSDTFGVVAH